MDGFLDNRYKLDVTETILDDETITVFLSFSGREYPDFINYINDKFFKKDPMYYYDDSIEGQFILLRSSLSGTPIDSEAEERIRKEAESDMRIHYHEKNDDSIGGRFILLKSSLSGIPIDNEAEEGLRKEVENNIRIHYHGRRDFENYFYKGKLIFRPVENK